MSQARRERTKPQASAVPAASHPTRLPSQIILLAGLIVAVSIIVLAAHWSALSATAISFDDSEYLLDNRLVQNPSWESAGRFLGEVTAPSTVGGYYQPLAMISLMFDSAMGGRPDYLLPYHRTSLALHVLNTALVIVFIYLLFGRAWPAALAGLVFGVHPMTVETIPWIGERKTLLAAFFALLALIFYVLYGRSSKRRAAWYSLCLAAYILALMSKPTSTPLPLMLLLLDVWPLQRLSWRAVVEKLPLLAIGGVSAVITYVSQHNTLSTALPTEYGPLRIPLLLCHNIVFYLNQMVWPVRLSSHYPIPSPLSLGDRSILAGVVGTCILIPLLILSLRWTRALLIGWLVFFVALLPTTGIIGFNNVIAADKYAYLPSIGILLILTWLLSRYWTLDATPKAWTGSSAVALAVVILVAGAEFVQTRSYLRSWQDTRSLCQHMLDLAPDAAIAHLSMGNYLVDQGQYDDAIVHFNKALQVEPNNAQTHYNLANALRQKGRRDEAIEHYNISLNLMPKLSQAHNNLAMALAQFGRFAEAVPHYREAIALRPESPVAQYNLGLALAELGRADEAIEAFRATLRLQPRSADSWCNIGMLLSREGHLPEASEAYRQALQIDPNHQRTLAALAALRSAGSLPAR